VAVCGAGAASGDDFCAYVAVVSKVDRCQVGRASLVPSRRTGGPYLARFSRDVGYHSSFPLTLDSSDMLSGQHRRYPTSGEKRARCGAHPSFVRELALHELFVVDHELRIGAGSQLMQIHAQAVAFAAGALRMDSVEEPVQAVTQGQYNTQQARHSDYLG
jgi:hypothetical protein